ncbi:MAG: peptidoglycan DD-metalloendopeptidase family protein [Gammaproteobacteria bacterium]|nr:peptidoglycan DD-metalloendopeptidase family protein [Gammaproteobacteria bacterium]
MVERETVDRRIETEKIGGSVIRIVQSGDTLHAIAFASGLDVNELAAWNNLSDTSKLNIGQRIRLTKPLNYKPTSVARRSTQTRTETAGAKRQTSNVPEQTQTAQPARRSSSRSARENQRLQNELGWRWPVRGRVINGFSSRQSPQGIDIAAAKNTPVLAAAPGEVVYVGNGLKGYGNLVIIKHNDQYLSAYAHNHSTYVSEGQKVFSQTSIGSIGNNKQGVTALQFQIRRHGQPVNPLLYLPNR